MKTLFPAWVPLIGLLWLVAAGCQPAPDTTSYLPKPPAPVLNRTCQYLRDPTNLREDFARYYPLLEHTCDSLIGAKQFNQAADALIAHGHAAREAPAFNMRFLERLEGFLTRHEKDIAAPKAHELYYLLAAASLYSPFPERMPAYIRHIQSAPDDYYAQRNIGDIYCANARRYFLINKLDSMEIEGRKALAIFERLRDTAYMSSAYNVLARVYIHQYAYTLAVEAATRQLYWARLAGDTMAIIVALFNQFELYKVQAPNQASHSIEESFQLARSLKIQEKLDIFNWIVVNGAYADYLIQQHCYPEAKEYLYVIQQLIPEATAHLQPRLLADYHYFADMYSVATTGRVADREATRKLVDQFRAKKAFYQMARVTRSLQQDAVNRKDYRAAYQYQSEQAMLRDTLWNNELRGKLFEQEKKYQTRKKEQEIILQKSQLGYQQSLIILLSVSLIALLLGSGVLLLLVQRRRQNAENKQKQAFTALLFQQIEDERQRIAADLHDSLSHDVLALKNSLREGLPNPGARFDEIIREIRTISRNLHPVMFETVGLVLSVEQLIARIQESGELFLTAELQYDHPLPPNQELQLYRIIQEGLNNILKHAQAQAARITLQTTSQHLLLEIRDNGKGFDPRQALSDSKAFGIHSIRERTKALGGNASFQSGPDGTTLTIELPLP